MKRIIKILDKTGKYEPSYLSNPLYRIFFTKKDNEYYIIKNRKKSLITDLIKTEGITQEMVIKKNFQHLNQELYRIKIITEFDKEVDKLYLSIDKDKFIISRKFSNQYIILKEHPFEKKTYIDCFERTIDYRKNPNIFIMFGNKIDYFYTFCVKAEKTIDFLNFYQEGLQKLNLFNQEKEEL